MLSLVYKDIIDERNPSQAIVMVEYIHHNREKPIDHDTHFIVRLAPIFHGTQRIITMICTNKSSHTAITPEELQERIELIVALTTGKTQFYDAVGIQETSFSLSLMNNFNPKGNITKTYLCGSAPGIFVCFLDADETNWCSVAVAVNLFSNIMVVQDEKTAPNSTSVLYRHKLGHFPTTCNSFIFFYSGYITSDVNKFTDVRGSMYKLLAKLHPQTVILGFSCALKLHPTAMPKVHLAEHYEMRNKIKQRAEIRARTPAQAKKLLEEFDFLSSNQATETFSLLALILRAGSDVLGHIAPAYRAIAFSCDDLVTRR